jgi:hypothetical protein
MQQSSRAASTEKITEMYTPASGNPPSGCTNFINHQFVNIAKLTKISKFTPCLVSCRLQSRLSSYRAPSQLCYAVGTKTCAALP